MIVVTAKRGGTFRETLAIAKAYVEARKHHCESELLDEIVSAKPERPERRQASHSFDAFSGRVRWFSALRGGSRAIAAGVAFTFCDA